MKSENKTASEPKDFTTIMPTKSVEKGCSDTKKCSKCLKSKQFSDFYKKRGGKFGVEGRCKECRSKIDFIYTRENQDKVKQSRKRHYKSNLQKVKAKQAIYRTKNREKLRLYYRKFDKLNRNKITSRERRRYASDPNFKLKKNLRNRIRLALQNTAKQTSTDLLLGASTKQVRQHIESQFQSGMTWDNYGEWHIDHRLPCASFDLSNPDEQKVCFHYTNLQPLWAKDNLSKGAKHGTNA